MKILRKLPGAPAPTKAARVNTMSNDKYMNSLAIVADTPISLKGDDPPWKKITADQHAKVGDAGRAAAKEKARVRAIPVIELYKNGASNEDIAAATGIPAKTVRDIISRYTKSGKVKITPSKEDLRLAELFNSGMSYKDMAELMNFTGGALSSKLYKIRRMGLIGKREI